ncbi:MAG: nucleotidyltransferase domain-containing protein [Candidatus Binataceae bacterium]
MTNLKAILEVATALGRVRAQWSIDGGWAIDLHLDRITREHHDIDVLILRRDQAALRPALEKFNLKKITPHPDGSPNRGTFSDWASDERLELPINMINAYRPNETEPAFQLMLADSEGRDWIYRRDPRVRRRLAAIGFEPLWGIPYVAPEIVLLFKAKSMLPKDEADFRNALPLLSIEARRWLREALRTAHAGHPWIARL